MQSSLWYPAYNLFFFFFLVYKVLWGKVKCVYTQSDDKFCHSKVLVEWFWFLMSFWQLHRGSPCMYLHRCVRTAGHLLHVSLLVLQQRFVSTTTLCEEWLHRHMYTTIFIEFSAEELCVNESAPEFLLLPIEGVISSCRLVFCSAFIHVPY